MASPSLPGLGTNFTAGLKSAGTGLVNTISKHPKASMAAAATILAAGPVKDTFMPSSGKAKEKPGFFKRVYNGITSLANKMEPLLTMASLFGFGNSKYLAIATSAISGLDSLIKGDLEGALGSALSAAASGGFSPNTGKSAAEPASS
ncbi:MAG: hypothetical protein AAGI66_01985 [Cyanobacteria bacterium P01_H01_bin.74]